MCVYVCGWVCVKRRERILSRHDSHERPLHAFNLTLSVFFFMSREICIQIKGKKFLFSQFSENLGRQRSLDGANMEHNIMASYHDENE
jgi:hypothetical protein